MKLRDGGKWVEWSMKPSDSKHVNVVFFYSVTLQTLPFFLAKRVDQDECTSKMILNRMTFHMSTHAAAHGNKSYKLHIFVSHASPYISKFFHDTLSMRS